VTGLNQGAKLLGQVFVYLLVLSGVAVMLLPFAWMLVTSFKLPSEVEKWPPQWTTENLFSHRNLKTVPSFGAARSIDFSALSFKEFLNLLSFRSEDSSKNVVVLKVDDDPVRRGEIHIKIEPNDVPHVVPPLSKFRSNFAIYERELPQNVAQVYDNVMQNVSSTEDFLDRFFELFLFSKNPFMGRDFLPEEVSVELGRLKGLLERYGEKLVAHWSLRSKSSDGSEVVEAKQRVRKLVEESVSGLESELEELMLTLDDYKKGLNPTLSAAELANLRTELQGLLEWNLRHRVEKELGYVPDFAESLFNFYESRFMAPIRAWVNLIELFQQVWDSYKALQKGSAAEIVVRLKTPEEVRQEIVNAVEKEVSLSHDKTLILTLLEAAGPRKVVDRYIGELNKRLFTLMDQSGFHGDRQALLVTLNDLVSNVREFVSVSDVDKLIGVARTWKELEDGLTKLLKGDPLLVSKIEKFKNTAQYEQLAHQLFLIKWQQSKDIQKLSKLVTDTRNSTVPINLPNTVKNVRCVGGESFEIESNYHRVWFYDSKFSVEARFTPGEVFLNFFQNYVDAWKAAPFGRYYINTVFVATITTVLEVIIAAMAAFAFAKLDFFGRDFLFTLYLATMMVPGEVLLVPNYITLTKFGWIDTYYALIVPWVVQVFAIFLMRQHFKTLPDELFDAAKIDGASKWRFLWTVVLPLSKPVVITSALLKFVGSWNAFLWVLIVTKSPEMRTLPVGLQTFSSEVGTLYNQLMAASTFSMLPVILLFLFTQRYFIRGIARTGLK